MDKDAIRMTSPELESLKKEYSTEELKSVLYCRDEIRGLVWQDRAMGYSDEEIEESMGKYLDEVYNSYQESAYVDYGISEKEFDRIYTIMEDIDGLVRL